MSMPGKHIKAGALYLGATLIDSVVPFITLPIFTHILLLEDFGALALVQIFALLVGGLANFGMATAYNRNYFEYCDDRKKTGELFFTTIGFVCGMSFAMMVGTFVFQHALARVFLRSYDHSELLLWALAANILINLRLFFLTYLRNMERPQQYIINTICFSVLNLVLSVYFVVVAKAGVAGILCGQVLASVIILIGLLVQFLRELPLGWNTKLLKEALGLGAPTVPMVFFSVVSNHFDKYLLGLLATLDGVGVYSIGQKIANLNFTFTTSLQNVFSPQVYKKMFKGTRDSRKEIGVYLIPFAYLICFVALMIVLFADEIVRLMAAPSFASSADIVIILTLFYTVLFFAKINGDQLIFSKKTYLTTILILGAALLNIAFNIPFIKMWGALGAAWATLLARIIAGVVIFKIAQKFFKIDWQTKPMVLIFGTLFLSAFGLIFLRKLLIAYTGLLSYKIVVIGFYLSMSRFVGVDFKEILSGLLVRK